MKTAVTFLFTLLNYLLYSQNIVLNSSFEEYTSCPTGFKCMDNVNNWELSDKFSSDFIHTCDTTIESCRYCGYIEPHKGKGCAAFSSFESIVGKLSSSLKKDSLYEISAYIHLAPKSNAYFEYIGIYLESYSDGNILKLKTYTSLNDSKWYKPLIKIECDSCKNKKWIKVTAIYKAYGNENLLCIGSIPSVINGELFSGQKLMPGISNPNNIKNFVTIQVAN